MISREYPPETCWGGIGVYSTLLSKELALRGHRVHVICQTLGQERTVERGNLTVHKIRNSYYFFPRIATTEFAQRINYIRAVRRRFLKIHSQQPFDVVEGPNFSAEGLGVSFIKEVPLVTRLHSSLNEVAKAYGKRPTWDSQLSASLENWTLYRSQAVTCSTRAHAELVGQTAGYNPASIHILPLGVPIPEDTRPPSSEKAKEPLVLFLGRLEPRKGVDTLVRAIPQVLEKAPKTSFLFAGRDIYINGETHSVIGPPRLSYKRHLERLLPDSARNRVTFLGHVSDIQRRELLADCDLFVAPSTYESCGFVYLEAMSYARPVIGCNVGGVPEVVKHGETGLLVPPSDPGALARAILDVLSRPGQTSRMGAQARAWVETHFSLDQMVTRTEQLYASLVKDFSARKKAR
ncbi:MAG: glycosyltransferase family 4 protein [Candidatus Omnitrophica bacterium]|nr:glycosyltransferase family 4 protein [Candidatus Omnitrophota bacterium]